MLTVYNIKWGAIVLKKIKKKEDFFGNKHNIYIRKYTLLYIYTGM